MQILTIWWFTYNSTYQRKNDLKRTHITCHVTKTSYILTIRVVCSLEYVNYFLVHVGPLSKIQNKYTDQVYIFFSA